MTQPHAFRECRFSHPETGKYLGFCRNSGPTYENAEFHPLAEPFNPIESCVDKGPFRHQEGRKRK